MKRIKLLSTIVFVLLLAGCNTTSNKKNSVKTDKNGFVILTDDQVDNIIKRAYQYLALYNVNNKFAISQGGWNTILADTKLKDL